ncbi:NEW3 domain-containing protein [Streptomyces sp. Tue 6430]|nr:NEW3 domain-containing protein [Streptomyces sp. Tue 6430]
MLPALAASVTLPEPLPPLDTPLAQGSPAEVVVTLTNRSAARLDRLAATLLTPSGWTVERSGSAPRSLAAGDSADVRFTVTPAADATVGSLIVAAHADGGGLLKIADARVRTGVAAAMSVALTGPSASPRTDGTVLSPGRPLTVTATVTNAGGAPLTGMAGALTLPDGWTATPSAHAPTTVAARSSAALTWDVVAPASAARTSATVEATVTASLGGRAKKQTASLTAGVGPVMTGYLLAEDFESVAPSLATAVDLSRPGLTGWTRTAPEGWTVTNAPTMPQGTRELQGWSFLSKQFWFPAGQDRPGFGRGLGIVAVADPDDWDDTGNPASRGRFDSTLTSPAVAIPPGTSTLRLGFDSHYRQESPQEAEVTVEFDSGPATRVLHYSSAASGNTNNGEDQQNRLVDLSFAVPSGATSVKVNFRLHNAGNNWFWAIDNVRLGTGPLTDA